MKKLILTFIISFLSIAFASDNFHSLKAKSLQGKEIDFSKYKGKIVLIVNTASRCGYTPQFEGLQKLYSEYKSKGFVILGFPSNDFKQEDMEGEKLAKFCKLNYGVEFTMFQKSHVNGKERHAVYDYLVKNSSTPEEDVRWNFEKFLVGKDGKVIGRYPSAMTPQDLKKSIEKALN